MQQSHLVLPSPLALPFLIALACLCTVHFFVCCFVLLNRYSSGWKKWRMEKTGESGTKPVNWKYCWCTTYFRNPQWQERLFRKDNDYMMNQPSSYSADSLIAPSCHAHSFPCSSSAPCNNYHHFSRFWEQSYVPLSLGLGTEVRLWSLFQIYLPGQFSSFRATACGTHAFRFLRWHTDCNLLQPFSPLCFLIFSPCFQTFVEYPGNDIQENIGEIWSHGEVVM